VPGKRGEVSDAQKKKEEYKGQYKAGCQKGNKTWTYGTNKKDFLLERNRMKKGGGQSWVGLEKRESRTKNEDGEKQKIL